jgi:hypothetical protein
VVAVALSSVAFTEDPAFACAFATNPDMIGGGGNRVPFAQLPLFAKPVACGNCVTVNTCPRHSRSRAREEHSDESLRKKNKVSTSRYPY